MKQISTRIVTAAVLTCGLSSCWFPCAPAVYGTVTDGSAETPLDSVKVDLFEGDEFVQSVYSDTLGRFGFDLDNESVFMTKKCERDFKLIFDKQGFEENQYIGSAPEVGIRIDL